MQWLDNIHLTLFWYIAISLICVIVLVVFGLYLIWTYHKGKPLAAFLWYRLKSWTNPRIALLEVFDLTNDIQFYEGKKETGDGYRPIHTIAGQATLKNRIMAWLRPSYIRPLPDVLIIPRSIYGCNGLSLIPVWNIFCELPADVLHGLEILVKNDVTTLEQLKKLATSERKNEVLFKTKTNAYTLDQFLSLYNSTMQKYSLNVYTEDVLNFMDTDFDKNFKESINCANFNTGMKRKQESYLKYALGILALVIIFVGIKMIYKTIYG